ncbi:MAG: haloacid dehalogenase type II [Candidatus Latescibacterota bacterium]|nr:haloacid dehalogenase type II [Candidatus Latescibacterota bacterium]
MDKENIKALTFDLFGTVLDLGGSLVPFIGPFLKEKGSEVEAEGLWAQWRLRQRVEQYQDNIMALGHSGYREVARRARVYVLELNGVEASADEVRGFMCCWQELKPFPEVRGALERLKARYKLVALSNGEPEFLAHLAHNQIQWDFDAIISVMEVGAFKPHPGVYRHAAHRLGLEVGECLMVSANAFDVVGGRACGMRGIYVDRYKLPYDDRPFPPDAVVVDFDGLADELL